MILRSPMIPILFSSLYLAGMMMTMKQVAEALVEPTFITSSYDAAAWLDQQNGKSTVIDNELIIFPKLLSEPLCKELEGYLEQKIAQEEMVRGISEDPDSFLHHVLREDVGIFSHVLDSSVEIGDAVTYAKEGYSDYATYVGSHYDELMYGVDASHKILIYLDDVAGTNFWTSREEEEAGIPPTHVLPARGTLVIFSMSLYHASCPFEKREGVIKRTLGLRLKPLGFSDMCPSLASNSPLILPLNESSSSSSKGANTTCTSSMEHDNTNSSSSGSCLTTTNTAAITSKDLMVFPQLLPEEACQELDHYLDALVEMNQNLTRGIVSSSSVEEQMGVASGRRNSRRVMSLEDVIQWHSVDSRDSNRSSISPIKPSDSMPSLSSIEYTDIITFTKESGFDYNEYVGPHCDQRLNEATHKLVVYLDDDAGRDEFWLTEASYRRMESPYAVVKSVRGLVVVYSLNTFHDSVFEDVDVIRRTLGIRVKGIY